MKENIISRIKKPAKKGVQPKTKAPQPKLPEYNEINKYPKRKGLLPDPYRWHPCRL